MLTSESGRGLVTGSAPGNPGGRRMRVEITRDTVAQGARVAAGTVLEVDEAEARVLIHCGKARPARAEAEAAVAGETREKATARGGRKKR